MDLPDDLIGDLRVLEQKRIRYLDAAENGTAEVELHAAQQLAIAAGCLNEYLPTEAPASSESNHG